MDSSIAHLPPYVQPSPLADEFARLTRFNFGRHLVLSGRVNDTMGERCRLCARPKRYPLWDTVSAVQGHRRPDPRHCENCGSCLCVPDSIA